MADNDPTAALEEKRAALRELAGQHFIDLDMARRRRAERAIEIGHSLLAALDEVLKQADGWETTAGRLMGFDDRSSRTFDECAGMIRAAVTAALTGKENGDGT